MITESPRFTHRNNRMILAFAGFLALFFSAPQIRAD